MTLAGLNERLMKYNEGLFFGKWRLDGETPDKALLGRGSYGRVYSIYREEKDSTGSVCRYSAALKVIPIDEETVCPNSSAGRESKQEILNRELRIVRGEIEIMRRMEGECSNIAYFQNSVVIRRMDTDLESWDVLIAMEKLIVLPKYMEESGLVPGSYSYLKRVLYIWKEIGAALSVCERNSILHTDVKPGNVFYAPGPDHFKLSDFGTSITSATFKSGIRYGTVDYMAPEMYHKQGGDSRVDLYSLAVMIYELLNGGRLPLQQGDGAEDRRNACKQRLDGLKPVPPLKSVPADVNEVLLRCLESDPKRRFANCRDAADASLELYLKYNRMRAGDFVPKGGNKWLMPVLIGALALGVLGAGAIVVAGLSGGDDQPTTVVVDAAHVETQDVETQVVETQIVETQPVEAQVVETQPAETQTVETQPVEAQPVETQIPAAPTPEPTPAPVRLGIAFDSPDLNQFVEGSNAAVSGRLSVAQGELDLKDLVLFADGREWAMEIAPGEKGYTFRSELQLNHAGQFELDVGIRLRGTQEDLASGVLSFEAVTPAPTASPTPAPTPEPTPAPVLRLGVESLTEMDERAVLRGRIASDVPIDPQRLTLSVNGVNWALEIDELEGAYAFAATGELPQDETDAVIVVAQLETDGEPVQSQSVDLSLEKLRPTPTPVPVLALAMDEEAVEAGTGSVTLHGRLTIQGELSEEELALSINGSGAQTEWRPVEGGYEFTASLEMDLEEMDALEVRVGALGNSDVEAAQAVVPVVVPTPSPEPTPEALAPIVLENAEALEGRWFGSDSVVSIAGTAQAGKVLNIAVNGETIGNATVEADGRFETELLSGSLKEGVNAIRLAYAQVQSEALAELNVGLDTIAPVVSAETQIDQDTREISVQIEDADASCAVTLSVAGEAVREAQAQNGEAVLENIDSLSLYDTSEIVLTVTDRAGNASAVNVDYARALKDIQVSVKPHSILSGGAYGVNGEFTLVIAAEPNAEVSVEFNGETVPIDVNENGAAEWMMDASLLLEDDNEFTVRYAGYGGQPVKNDHAAAVILRRDITPPDAVVAPRRLFAGQERTIAVEAPGEAQWSAELYVEQLCLCIESSEEGEPISLAVPDEIPLSEETDIEVRVYDSVGNFVSIPVEYVELQPIRIDCGGEIWGTQSETTLSISGKADALVNLRINNGEILQARIGEKVDIGNLLQSGANTIAAWYAKENDYPEEAMEGTESEAAVEYDPDSPEATVDVGSITRDTESLTLTVSNEPYGYWVKLWVDGEVVESQEDIYSSQVVIDGIDRLNLSEDQTIELEVGDGRNPSTVIPMLYFDTTERADMHAFVQTELPDSASAGEELTLDAIVLCDRYRMSEGYVNMYLVDEDESRQSCRFTRKEEEWTDEITARLDANSVKLSSEVDACYRITGVTIPADCAEGQFRLAVGVEADNRSTVFYLGTLNIAASAAGSGDSEPFSSEERGYAIGFDEQLQSEFRPDDVVLTGWVGHAVGTEAYFDSCVLLDAYGRQVMVLPIGPEELSRYSRGELPADAAAAVSGAPGEGEAAQPDLSDSGFVLKLDLSDAAITDGDEYELQLYSSNEIGEKWAMISTKLCIHSAAPEVGEAELASRIDQWRPVEETAP